MPTEDKGIPPEHIGAEYVYVDSYDGKEMKGGFYSRAFPNRSFSSVMQLLELIGRSVDNAGLPAAYDSIKSFSQPVAADADETAGEADSNKCGDEATFIINILFRQNSSWQGIIKWVEGKKEESFRSVYEMLMLMDSALESVKSPSDRRKF